MKKFILGLIFGLLLSSSVVYVGAAMNIVANPFPVLINGTKTAVEGWNISGSTFLKLRDFEKANLGVNFNATTKQIEITNPPVATGTVTSTPDGITTFLNYSGKQYIGAGIIRNKIEEKGYTLTCNADSTVWQVLKGQTIILDNVQIARIQGVFYIDTNYYINTILPLIK